MKRSLGQQMSLPPIMQSEEQIAEASERRRRRTFRRTVGGFVSCIVLLAGVRVWWGIESGRRLRQEIARIRAAGEPLLVDDFNPTAKIPDEENAAILYEKASAALVEAESGALSLVDFCNDARVCDTYPQDARALVALNAESLRLLREARSRDKVDWNVRLTSPLINLLFPRLSAHRSLAKFGRSVAHVQFRAGEHAAAIETVRDTVKLGENVSGTPRATSYVLRVAILCEALAIEPLETFIHELAVSTGSSGRQISPVTSPADRGQVETLIRELLDDERLWRALKISMQVERATLLDTVQSFLSGKLGPATIYGPPPPFPLQLRVAARPAFELDGLYGLRHVSDVARATTFRNWPAVSAVLERADQHLWSGHHRGSLNGSMHILSQLHVASLGWTNRKHFRMIASRRMAGIALAMRLFELDRGRRPAELAELVPDYLVALPADPFAGDGRPLGYQPSGERPVLYSISNDGRDDGGQYELKADGSVDWYPKDLVYFLNGDRPLDAPPTPSGVTPLSGQAVEDYSEDEARPDDGAGQGEEDGGQSVSTLSDTHRGVLTAR